MNAIVSTARSYLRTPYHHQARVKGVGIDCAGLPICVARDLGLVPRRFDITGYARTPDGKSLIAYCEQWMKRIHTPELGAVIVTHFKGSTAPQHLGIVADYIHGGFSVIHAMGTADGKGRVVEQRLDEETMMRMVGLFRMPGAT